jgi:hypothetical protein
MSDNFLRLIPTDPTWTPSTGAAQQATATLSALVPNAESVTVELYEEVTFIDQGGNFERLTCPACQAPLEMDWWADRMDDAAQSQFTDLAVVTPCCGATTSLNDLAYDWPAGFARVELSAMNPGRDWLQDSELAQVSAVFGHPVKQVMARY